MCERSDGAGAPRVGVKLLSACDKRVTSGDGKYEDGAAGGGGRGGSLGIGDGGKSDVGGGDEAEALVGLRGG